MCAVASARKFARTDLCGWHRYVMPGLRLSVQWFRRGDQSIFWVDAKEPLYICVLRDHVPVRTTSTRWTSNSEELFVTKRAEKHVHK